MKKGNWRENRKRTKAKKERGLRWVLNCMNTIIAVIYNHRNYLLVSSAVKLDKRYLIYLEVILEIIIYSSVLTSVFTFMSSSNYPAS